MTALAEPLSNLTSVLLCGRLPDRVEDPAEPAVAVAILYAIASVYTVFISTFAMPS